MGLEARIWAFWIGFGPRDWDSGLGTGIWASRLGGWTDGQRRKRKSPICVKEEREEVGGHKGDKREEEEEFIEEKVVKK